jgi:hypothetical protein
MKLVKTLVAVVAMVFFFACEEKSKPATQAATTPEAPKPLPVEVAKDINKMMSDAFQGTWDLGKGNGLTISGSTLTYSKDGNARSEPSTISFGSPKEGKCGEVPKAYNKTVGDGITTMVETNKGGFVCWLIKSVDSNAIELIQLTPDGKPVTWLRKGSGKTAAAVPPVTAACTLTAGTLGGVKLGDPMSKVTENYPVKTKYKNGEGSFDVYVKSKDKVNDMMIFPIKRDGKEVANLVEYTGNCTTKEGIKVGSTVADLKKAYPALKANGSEVEGRTIAKGGGYTFLLDTYESSYELDVAKLKPTVKVKAIVLQ